MTVFPAKDNNTPVNVSGWTVQNSATGTDQSLTESAGVTSAVALAQVVAHQTATGQGSFAAPVAPSALGGGSYVAPADATTAAKLADLKTVAAAVDTLNATVATLAKLADLQSSAGKLDTLNAALITSGVEAAS